MTYPVKSPRKLIEVALPLDAINAACVREKSIRHGHPSTLHLWWARRPLAAARAVLFAQLVNDPSWKWEMEHSGEIPPGHLKASWAASRKRLFKMIEDLVLWGNTTNEKVLEPAREEIRKSWREVCELNKEHPEAAELFNPEKLPAFHDPFAGGGAIPLEAQRLGLEAHASDLNPVAVLINKAMIEIPPKFAGRPPVGPLPTGERELDLRKEWPGATGLAEDVRRYGAWMRAEAHKRIGHLYPPVEITAEMACERPDLKPLIGQRLTVIAWLWARTVKSPNPAFSHVDVPLVSNFILSSKEGKGAYAYPVVVGDCYSFSVTKGIPPSQAAEGTKAVGRGANFRCIVSDVPISGDYIKAEGQAGRMGARLMAVVAETTRGRVYLAPTPEMEIVAAHAEPTWKPVGDVPARLSGGTCVPYGLRQWGDLFTRRQLLALTTLSDIVAEARGKVRQEALATGFGDDGNGLDTGGSSATAYAEAVSVFLGFLVDQQTNQSSTLCGWNSINQQMIVTFSRQAIPMIWDYAECNVLSTSTGSFSNLLERQVKGIATLGVGTAAGMALQLDAAIQDESSQRVVSTDPPYYDNIFYADLSDFFYVWLRRSLRSVYPNLLATISVPKAQELVATPYRHGSKENAELFFLNGLKQAMHQLSCQAHPAFPITVYYAFKQSESRLDSGPSNTGWGTFLNAVLRAGLAITGTWPVKTESSNKLKAEVNALASSIILVCRKRLADAPTVSRREFLRELNAVLPEALDEMTKGSGDDRSPVAPVDLSQAIIGPGMAVFSKYSAVLEADGSSMSVRTALQLINRFLTEDDFDADTQFCLHWFEQHGWSEGRFGDAETLSRAKGTSVDGVRDTGVIESGGGIVRLRKWSEYPANWDPQKDTRNPVWETLHHLIRAQRQDGDSGAGRVLTGVRDKGEAARQLAYRLYTLCERQGWAEDARAYNELITGWDGIESAAMPVPVNAQLDLFE